MYDRAADNLAKLDPTKLTRAGKVYEVSIKADPDQFLDWDKPLSQQPENIRYVMGHHAGLTAEEAAKLDREYPTGKAIHDELMNQQRDLAIRQGRNADTTLPKSQEAATKELRDMGIPGIKYLDQGSRVTPVSTFNEEQAVMDAFKAHRAAPTAETQKALEAAQSALDAAKNKPNVTHNYVVFDDKLIDILKKYAVAGAVGGSLASLGQPPAEEQK
jgi:hypothetical protein